MKYDTRTNCSLGRAAAVWSQVRLQCVRIGTRLQLLLYYLASCTGRIKSDWATRAAFYTRLSVPEEFSSTDGKLQKRAETVMDRARGA